MRLSALVFDFDGLLFDSEIPIFESWRWLYAQQGHELTPAEFAQCIGSDWQTWNPERRLEELVGHPLPWEALHPERHEICRQKMEEAQLLPGARDRIEEAVALGLPLAVASSSPHSWVDPWLKKFGLLAHFHSLHCADDVERVKPAPDLFLRATEALGHPPAETLVLEDSRNGLLAARAAGNPCLVVPNEVTRALSFEGAWRRAESLAAFSFQALLEETATASAHKPAR
ncbi:MAG: HAD family hydrolase [Verrucomicrobiota bacterium]